jgi:hypothetical protein
MKNIIFGLYYKMILLFKKEPNKNDIKAHTYYSLLKGCSKDYVFFKGYLDYFNEGRFTCDGCSIENECKYSYDLYNTDGDCLAYK